MLNRRVSGGCFPFWGCPAGRLRDFLGPKHHRGHDVDELAEQRLIDLLDGRRAAVLEAGLYRLGRQPGPDRHPGRAGVARRSRAGPTAPASGRSRPGSVCPTRPRIVFAEVWPSWWQEFRPNTARQTTRRRYARSPRSSPRSARARRTGGMVRRRPQPHRRPAPHHHHRRSLDTGRDGTANPIATLDFARIGGHCGLGSAGCTVRNRTAACK